MRRFLPLLSLVACLAVAVPIVFVNAQDGLGPSTSISPKPATPLPEGTPPVPPVASPAMQQAEAPPPPDTKAGIGPSTSVLPRPASGQPAPERTAAMPSKPGPPALMGV